MYVRSSAIFPPKCPTQENKGIAVNTRQPCSKSPPHCFQHCWELDVTSNMAAASFQPSRPGVTLFSSAMISQSIMVKNGRYLLPCMATLWVLYRLSRLYHSRCGGAFTMGHFQNSSDPMKRLIIVTSETTMCLGTLVVAAIHCVNLLTQPTYT